jgi:hypothetical protein
MNLLGILVLLHATQGIIVSTGKITDQGWFLWDAVNVLSVAVLAWLLFNQISFRNLRLKLVSFLFLLMAFWSLFSFILLSFFTDSLPLTAFCAFVLFVPSVSWALFKDFLPPGDKYTGSGTYLVYNQPRGVIGLLALSVGYKGSGVSLVIDKTEFAFEGGGSGKLELVEREYKRAPHKYYHRVEAVNAGTARSLVGEKWHWRRNCFHVFRKFNKPLNTSH